MTGRHRAWRTRQDIRAAEGVLLVLRDAPAPPPPARGQPPIVPGNPAEGPEILLVVGDDGQATVLAGHVDLGTGIRTAYAQLVAEELDLPLAQVQVVLGDTARAPNQGPTIASTSIQIHAQPLRLAAAQARAWLRAEAAQRWGVPPESLTSRDGLLSLPDGRQVGYGALLRGRHVELMLDASTPLKPVAEHRVVGTSAPRVDIPAKATGQAVFVHDMRVPGMLHGRVVRPPYAGVDAGDFVGRTLKSVDESSIAHLPGIVGLVVQGDFIGVVAEREDQAEAAMHALRVDWHPWPALPPLDDLAQALSAHPSTPRVVAEQGDVDAARAAAAQPMDRRYVWPYQMHASIGPSCALADWRGDALTVWAGTQNPHVLRADLARLTGLADTAIEVVRLEAAGCYGRNGADDVAADAALMSRAVGRPVRVQLTREQEHAWEPKGAAQLMDVRGGLDAQGAPVGYDFATSYPSNGAPTLALLLTRTIEPVAQAFEMGDRTAVPPYGYPHQRITVNDMAPILRASWLRGVSALPNSFAHESYIDELATAAGVDPVAYRLRYLKDERAAELVRATADKAGWKPHTVPQQQGARGDWLQGQGFAYARYVHSRFPGFGAAWAAWVADVEVHRETGEVHVSRVVVGHDAGLMVNPAGVQQQVHGNVLQTTSRALKERVQVDPDTRAVASRDWGAYPILSFREVPVVEVLLMPRPGEAPLGVGESASVPGTAAIANAIFDATGVRFRDPPFTPEVVRAALHPLPAPSAVAEPAPARAPVVPVAPAADPQRGRKRPWAVALALVGGALGLGAAALGWRPAIAPVQGSASGVYGAAIVERGRQLAALGNCAVCHTAPGGVVNAGGRAMVTPFGTLYSTNLTPDADTGLGRWSFSAFQRAMREGVSRDGHHLYPAFPFTSFTQASDDDLMALYAHLMSQPPVRAETPASTMRFPFNLRPLMGLWNALHLQPGPAPAVAGHNAQWQRGASLVNGLGHCGACHTPRDATGAERTQSAYLGGALVQGWDAPALGALSRSPVPWTEDTLVQYLRQGHSPQHGVAGGPMAPVVRGLATLPEDDVRAMAHYLMSLQATPREASPTASAEALIARSQAQAAVLRGPAQRMFDSACGACHHDGDGPEVAGLNLPLALNGKLHAERPDNLLRTVIDGIQDPAFPRLGHMPAFGRAIDDRQLAELAAYLRQRFAPGQPAWDDLPAAVARARAAQ
ncbi:molybdopterin cofactor-binding domain-containing protein [Ideonella sp. A 288]|uniref:molybdopterin cofactor-binding domain-containing protein n=1 Tax=Ideonella sp. A 288 TaxID=1962181 RepID=UPI000B4AEA92|nr:molybdopterin cofactor-binding domain-containing protein [Ideonella sp. A 288]